MCHVLSHFSCVWRFVTLWTVACQAPLSIACKAPLSRLEYWSRLPEPPPADLLHPDIKPTPPAALAAPALQADSLLLSHQGISDSHLYYNVIATVALLTSLSHHVIIISFFVIGKLRSFLSFLLSLFLSLKDHVTSGETGLMVPETPFITVLPSGARSVLLAAVYWPWDFC